MHGALPPALRPLLGVQFAPPVVAGVAYMSLTTGAPDIFAMFLLGYGLYQALLLFRLLPWIRKQAFVPCYWAFSFGVTALPTMAIRMLERGAAGPLESAVPVAFIVANLIIGVLVIKTVELVLRGSLLPPAAVAVDATRAPAASRIERGS
ncbi:voltage-gated anion channel [Paraburkholderia sp. BL6669N2]|nr:voltage-gated anion channel [Paraburkholderia sp. BL6669N2]